MVISLEGRGPTELIADTKHTRPRPTYVQLKPACVRVRFKVYAMQTGFWILAPRVKIS